ncbi:GNAT family N-acetyltransferase [Streptomyces luteolifulvus]|jgi:N-acetylglutamate synthase-like GNAT family acetyltransferase|uniref:GNAT family N-acetyltransferase n=1 Tax=Streptomyces luteolifulvus TaxID=2615112 RepID=A0A6H9V3R0_9ACTN|nr:GNAT family N-acetyltransferase [Streptomyces luteolifulvus]KAB1146314.1 GNAT family N-acetyltransferase [Streptomyces luteolifulvus]
MAAWSTRAACAADLPLLRSLLAESCETTVVPSSPLLADAIERDLVRVAESEGELVGCIAAEMPSPGHARLSVIAVRAGIRRQRVASQLLTEMVKELPRKANELPLISAVARTDELAVTRLLLACGFIGTRIMRTGATDRALHIHYQYKSRVEYIDPDARHLVHVSAQAQLAESLAPSDHAVTALVTLGGEPAFEIARFEQDDPAALQSGEAAAGIAFSGSILAAITFLLGFAFTSTRFPDDVRLLLIWATFSTVLSLIVYASASGELARIRSNSFGRIMKWGNVLSEYGGVLPFLISLPVTYAQASGDPWTTMVLAVVLSAAIAWYERSEFSIAHRFRRSLSEQALMLLTAASPTVGAALVVAQTTSWPWTIVLTVTLAARTWLYLFRRGAEADIAERRQWQVRE